MKNSSEQETLTFYRWLTSDGNRAMSLFFGFVFATNVWWIFAYAPAERERKRLASENKALWFCIESGEAATKEKIDACLRDHDGAEEAMEEIRNQGREREYEGRASGRGR
jgi:hypothetical protein